MRLTRISFRFAPAVRREPVRVVAGLRASHCATSVVGILEGSATLIRQTTRYALAEGVALNEQDIIETAPGAFAQIELPGGVLVGIGESTRLMLRPRVGKGLAAPPLYLLQGWLKTSTSGAFGYASPAFEIATQAATTVVHTMGAQYEVFVESGAAKLTLRDGAQTVTQLASGDFAQRREGATPTVARRATPEFLAKVPRQFRDRLPARGEQFAKRNVAPKALGEIAYTDVAAWLRTEPALRLQLLPLWRVARGRPDLPRGGQGRSGTASRMGTLCRPRGLCAPHGRRGRAAPRAGGRSARHARSAAAAAAAASGDSTRRVGSKPIVNRRASCRNSATTDSQDWRISCAFCSSSI